MTAPVPTRVQLAERAETLINDLMAQPWGQVSASVYETGRLVALAPWLSGHRERVAWLLAAQHSDGSWGGPDGYEVVPTLSAIEALLAAAEGGSGLDPNLLRAAAHRGVSRMATLLPELTGLPDMPAIDLTVPYLIERLTCHLGDSAALLPLPAGISGRRLELARRMIADGGAALPDKLLHALEVIGRPASSVRPSPIGTVGASPAATAAWLDGQDGNATASAARWHLQHLATRYGGPVPVGLPITVFERGWVLSWLARGKVPFTATPEMLADLHAAIGPDGTPAGPGLPADADTTSVALYALALLDMPHAPTSLDVFDTGDHFATWPGEDGASTSVNAHALDALSAWLRHRPADAGRYGPVVTRLAGWLTARQHADGRWEDRWHASPYYATMSATLSLAELDAETGRVEHDAPVRQARAWVLATQRADGSWGLWNGTAEESAYAVLALLLGNPSAGRDEAGAALRALPHLLAGADRVDHPPMWHDKDLYCPIAVVRAAILTALHTVLGITTLVRESAVTK